MPKEIDGIEIEFMIYTLAGGDITKKREIESTMDITDYIEWTMLNKYDKYCEYEMNKRYQKNG